MTRAATTHIGVDVGGTFTDVFLVTRDGAHAASAKHLTTRPDPTGGILGALRQLRRDNAASWHQVEQVTVGSTLALNAVLESRGAPTALVTTEGFRDVLEIARERRAALYDLQQVATAPLIPRHRRYEVAERMSAAGEVIRPLDVGASAGRLLAWLDDSGVESVAICLLNSYANAEHEVLLQELLTRERPGLFVCTSADVLRQYREYERTLVTCVNAYVGPTMRDYLARLETGIASIAPDATVRITDSVGGAMNLTAAGNRPVLTVMSGPAAGVAGAAIVGTQAVRTGGPESIVAMDMGGTSCDVSVVAAGRPDLTRTVSIADHQFSLQAVDIHSIGAGGGTVAWVDDGGLLRVGPRSTGSDPGPACYGRSGTEATITDAHVVLGHLTPDLMLGDEVRIDHEAAERAVREHIARPLDMSVNAAAAGVVRVADASMQRAIEAITVRRGIDPRSCALVAYGGAAPLHAPSIARTLGIELTVIPRFAGVLSAMGAVWAPEHYEAVRACLLPTRALDDQLAAWVGELEDAAQRLAGADVRGRLVRDVAFDMRFVGQTATLRIPICSPEDPKVLDQAHQDFVTQYREVFGYLLPDTDSEVENIRVRVRVADDKEPLLAPAGQQVTRPPRPWTASFDDATPTPCQLWDVTAGARLPGAVRGPAILVADGSTAVVHAGQEATFDEHGNLIVRPYRGQEKR